MKTFSLEGAAEFLHVSKDSMRDMAASGKVPAAKIGPSSGYRWVFTEESLEEYLRDEVARQTRERRNQFGATPTVIDTRPKKAVIGAGRKARPIPSLMSY